jgi:hypothetical protein
MSLIIKLLLLVCVASMVSCGKPAKKNYPSYEHEWVCRYFNSIDGDTSYDEIIDFLIGLKFTLQKRGYPCKSITDTCYELRDELLILDINVYDCVFKPIFYHIRFHEFEIYPMDTQTDGGRILCLDGKILLKDDIRRMTIGFLKVVACSLLNNVPKEEVRDKGIKLGLQGLQELLQMNKELN